MKLYSSDCLFQINKLYDTKRKRVDIPALLLENEMSNIRYEKIKPIFFPLNNRIVKNENGMIIENNLYSFKDIWIYTPRSQTLNNYNAIN